MAGKFERKSFAEINLDDPFFNSLKADYPGSENSTGFVEWFHRKASENKKALVYEDEQGVAAFICLKPEAEAISLREGTLPNKLRLKISTIKIDERCRHQRLGEGAIGLTLWHWLDLGRDEIYVTVFEKQHTLISLLEKFGFYLAGTNLNGERVYMKSRDRIDFSDPYKSFPFLSSNMNSGRYLIINDYYHDTMFPYSELKNTLQESVDLIVANGLTKIYVGAAANSVPNIGEFLFIYRKFNGNGTKRYRSCLTTYCIVTNVIRAKISGRTLITFEDMIAQIGNKSVYDETELRTKYDNDANMIVIEMIYVGYFGAGNNVNMDWLDKHGCWSAPGQYPTSIKLSGSQIRQILTEGSIDVENVIINQA